MTWIFWRPELLKMQEMIVCSVFFLPASMITSFLTQNVHFWNQTINNPRDKIISSHYRLFLFGFLAFLHKTTWREYFVLSEITVWVMFVCSVFFFFFRLFLLQFWTLFSSLKTSHFCPFFEKYENYPFFSFFDNYRFLDLFYSLFKITLFYQF